MTFQKLEKKSLSVFSAALIILCFQHWTIASESKGLDTITEFDKMPFLKIGETVHQLSSHDKTGGNEDQGSTESGLTSYLYRENGKYIIFDEHVQGCIYRIWFTDLPTGNIQFYFDGETEPRINVSIIDFFNGSITPFVFPLAGDDTVSSGGFYSYLPFPYRKSLKIALTGFPSYYNITFKRYSSNQDISTFTGNENIGKALALLNSAGEPPVVSDSFETVIKVFSLQSNEEKYVTLAGSGIIYSFECSSLEETNPDFINFSDSLWLEIVWDHHISTDIRAPFSLFFGGGIKNFSCKSLAVGSSPDTRKFYCYLPMPFQNQVEIKLTNNSVFPTGKIEVKIQYLPTALPGLNETMGYLRTEYHAGSTQTGSDFIVLDTQGTGHVVGCVMDMFGSNRPRHLEGDERIYIDESQTPQLYGTGTEDFFNGGWYFNNGNFSLPYHGFPLGKVYATSRFICYRFLLTDYLNFYSHIKFGFEHGGMNNINAQYKSLVFWYGIDQPSLALSDHFDVGKKNQENLHNYHTNGIVSKRSKSDYYEGDYDDVLISDAGNHIKGQIEFSATIDPENGGVKLRRRLDYNQPHQQADVYVDGQLVGSWYDPGSNMSKGWRDSDFEIHPNFTRGKDNISVLIDTAPYNKEWTEYEYWIYSYADLWDIQLPSQLIPMSNTELNGTVATPLSDSVKVQVIDDQGNAVANYAVTFRILSGGGTINSMGDTSLTIATNAAGYAAASWTLGTVAGVIQQLQAAAMYNNADIDGSPITFSAVAQPDRPNQLMKMSGDDQVGVVAETLSEEIVIAVEDCWQNRTPDVPVQFTVISGGGMVAGQDSIERSTDENGQASVSWQLGQTAGEKQELRISSSALPDTFLLFGADALAGPATHIIPCGLTEFVGVVGRALEDSLCVSVSDQFDNPIVDFSVHFIVTAGDGSIGSPELDVQTNTNGIASCLWTLGHSADTINIVEAQAAGLAGSPIQFVASALPDRPHTLHKVSGDEQVGFINDRLEQPLTVSVSDTFGNFIQGHPVLFEIVEGNSSFDGATSSATTTDNRGQASTNLTLASLPEACKIRVSSKWQGFDLSGSPVQFTATAKFRPIDVSASTISATSPVVANGKDKSTISVQIRDDLGIEVPGLEITLDANGEGNQLTQPIEPTDENGTATGFLSSTLLGTKQVWATVADTLVVRDSATVVFVVDKAFQIQEVSGNSQTGVIAREVAGPVAVFVSDSVGHAVPDYPVDFVVSKGGGKPSRPQIVRTNQDGLASFQNWILGPKTGVNLLEARSEGLEGSPVIFEALGILGTPKSIDVNAGGDQRGEVETVLPDSFVVRVTDSLNIGLLSIPVHFDVLSGQGQFVGTNIDTSDELGFARALFQLGSVAGVSTIAAWTEGLADSAIFRCTAVDRPITQVTAVSGLSQSGRANETLADPLGVRVQDSGDNPAPSVEVWFKVVEGGGHILEPQPALTDSQGLAFAHWVLGSGVPQIAMATVADVPDTARFTARLNVNHAPVLQVPGDTTGTEMDSLSFFVSAYDPEGDSLTIRAYDLPAGAEFDSTNSGMFSWLPTFEQAGQYEVRFIAKDMLGATATATTKIHILNSNRPPVIAQYQPQDSVLVGHYGESIDFKIVANDLDNDSLYFFWKFNGIIISNQRTFTITPNETLPNSFKVMAFVTDSMDTTSHTWSINISSEVAERGSVPKKFELLQNHPNPFNPQTTVDFCVPKRQHITITIFNSYGQVIRELVNGAQAAGVHSVTWQGLDVSGNPVASGIYFYTMTAGEYINTKKLVLLR